jgi:hypothetical protein
MRYAMDVHVKMSSVDGTFTWEGTVVLDMCKSCHVRASCDKASLRRCELACNRASHVVEVR